jgi:hypothetical protein
VGSSIDNLKSRRAFRVQRAHLAGLRALLRAPRLFPSEIHMARFFNSIGEFTRFISAVAVAAGDDGKKEALEIMARAIRNKARSVLGTYEYCA